MKVEEYRDLADELFRKASDLKACVSDAERTAWIPSAEKLRLRAWSVEGTCKRASAADKAKMQRARKALDEAYDSVRGLVTESGADCPECGGEGEVDSGGFTPWGSPISLPCDTCSSKPKATLKTQ